MNIALLNEKIEIEECTISVDRVGNHKSVWTTGFVCHATISGESPSENSGGELVVDDSVIRFTVRWCQYTAGLTTTNHRVRFRNEIYNILGIDHINFKKKSMRLICQKIRSGA